VTQLFNVNADNVVMKIDGSAVFMSATHQLENSHVVNEKLEAWVDLPGMAIQRDNVTLSDKARDLSRAGEPTPSAVDSESVIEGDPKLLMIRELIEALTGRKIKVLKTSDVTREPEEIKNPSEVQSREPERVGWGLRYEYQESYTEKENTYVTAEGIVKTTDGKEIAFAVDLHMSREFVQTTAISLRAGDAARVDPLVINFNGSAAQLTDETFAFDLNSDGTDENIPFVAGGSGILVFDRNGDLRVNDGSELFGPNTGNGFGELSQYDGDGNRWIDESDTIYKNLYVWTKDLNGNDTLQGLKDSGIGAIYVTGIDASFALKDGENNLKGQMTRAGIYLTEDGRPATIQQLDVVI
jgi:hypothetical protein